MIERIKRKVSSTNKIGIKEHEPDTFRLVWPVPFAMMNALRMASCSTFANARGVQLPAQVILLIKKRLDFGHGGQNGKPLRYAGVVVRFAVVRNGGLKTVMACHRA